MRTVLSSAMRSSLGLKLALTWTRRRILLHTRSATSAVRTTPFCAICTHVNDHFTDRLGTDIGNVKKLEAFCVGHIRDVTTAFQVGNDVWSHSRISDVTVTNASATVSGPGATETIFGNIFEYGVNVSRRHQHNPVPPRPQPPAPQPRAAAAWPPLPWAATHPTPPFPVSTLTAHLQFRIVYGCLVSSTQQ